MDKNFDEWNRKKKEINAVNSEKAVYFKERQIWWCSLGVNIGVEIDGKNEYFERPALIIKAFKNGGLWILPITSRARFGIYYFQFQHNQEKSNIILSQLRFISCKRLLRKIGTIGKEEFRQIRSLVKNFI